MQYSDHCVLFDYNKNYRNLKVCLIEEMVLLGLVGLKELSKNVGKVGLMPLNLLPIFHHQ